MAIPFACWHDEAIHTILLAEFVGKSLSFLLLFEEI